MIKSIIQLLRPHQWLKNLFIFLPLFFDRQLTDLDKLLAVVGAFVADTCHNVTAFTCYLYRKGKMVFIWHNMFLSTS